MLFFDLIDIGFFLAGVLVGSIVTYLLEVIRND